MPISFVSKGDFSKTDKFIERALGVIKMGSLDKYGKAGVEALRFATPKDTGETANSWGYRVVHKKESSTIEFYNTNTSNNIPVAILIQYGHGTRNGGYVVGRDYINPAIRPLFDQIAEDAWKEMRDG